jgi:hypothetical protein
VGRDGLSPAARPAFGRRERVTCPAMWSLSRSSEHGYPPEEVPTWLAS